MPNSEKKIKPLALVIIELNLSEGISQNKKPYIIKSLNNAAKAPERYREASFWVIFLARKTHTSTLSLATH